MKSLEGLAVLCGILAVVLAGCEGDTGPKTVPVTGTVLMGGEPVEGADVNFMAGGASHAASGKTDAQGKFSLKTLDKEGAVVGTHTVTVAKYDSADTTEMTPEDYTKQMEAGSTAPPSGPESSLPAKYADPANSGLSETVEDGGANDFTITLEPGE